MTHYLINSLNGGGNEWNEIFSENDLLEHIINNK